MEQLDCEADHDREYRPQVLEKGTARSTRSTSVGSSPKLVQLYEWSSIIALRVV